MGLTVTAAVRIMTIIQMAACGKELRSFNCCPIHSESSDLSAASEMAKPPPKSTYKKNHNNCRQTKSFGVP